MLKNALLHSQPDFHFRTERIKIMNKEEHIKKLRRQWEEMVPHLVASPSSAPVAEEMAPVPNAVLKQEAKERKLEALLLQENGTAAYASTEPDDAWLLDEMDEEEPEESEETQNLRISLYGMIGARLLMVDAMDIFNACMAALPKDDTGILYERISKATIECLCRADCIEHAWQIVEMPRQRDAVDLALLLLEQRPGEPQNVERARAVVRREAEKALEMPNMPSHFTVVMAVWYWIRLWNETKHPADLRQARTLRDQTDIDGRVTACFHVFSRTWDEDDLMCLFKAAEAIKQPDKKAKEVVDIIDGLVNKVRLSNGDAALVQIIERVAVRLTNEKWKALLKERLQEMVRTLSAN